MFDKLNGEFGPFDIDRFASDYNSKCASFNSRWWCAGTKAIDAFSQMWAGYKNWVVPPPRLIPKVLSKICLERPKVCLVMPVWSSAPSWPEYLRIKDSQDLTVVETLLPRRGCVVGGRGNNGIFGGHVLNFDMVAAYIISSS